MPVSFPYKYTSADNTTHSVFIKGLHGGGLEILYTEDEDAADNLIQLLNHYGIESHADILGKAGIVQQKLRHAGSKH